MKLFALGGVSAPFTGEKKNLQSIALTEQADKLLVTYIIYRLENLMLFQMITSFKIYQNKTALVTCLHLIIPFLREVDTPIN